MRRRSGPDADREATEQQDQQRDPDHKRAHRMVESAVVLTMAHALTLAEWLSVPHPGLYVRHCTVVVANLSGLAALCGCRVGAALRRRPPASV